MPLSASLRTSITPRYVRTITEDLAEVDANTTAEQAITLKGVRPDMWIMAKGLSLPAGLCLVNAHCETADSLILTFANLTGAGIDPAEQAFEVLAL